MSKRPHIICLMMTSVDGKILGDKWGSDSRVKDLLTHFEKTHEDIGIKAWIVGRTTMEKDFTEYEMPVYKEDTGKIPRTDFVGTRDAQSFAIAVDGHGKLGWKSATMLGDHVITILTEAVQDGYLAHLQEIGASYIFAGTNELDLHIAMEKLRSLFCIDKLMLEGGGRLNGSFLNEGLIDEFYQLLLPLADGRTETSSVLEVAEKDRKRNATLLKLQDIKRFDDDVLLLKYRIDKGV
jgi:riboflavin biosynthesis pyrimidine reductase